MSGTLRDVINSFKCELDDEIKPTLTPIAAGKVSKRSPIKKKPRPNIPSINYKSQDLKDLPPSITSNLTVVFIGFNPGVESSKQQHHYAHPTNLFWKLFNALDLLSAVLDIRNTDVVSNDKLVKEIYQNGKSQARPEHDFELINLGIGFTDLVLRCTKQALELSQQEKIQNVPRLLSEFNDSRAPFIVFIGKGIWEFVCKYLVPKHKLTKQNFAWGVQKDPIIMLRFYFFCDYHPKVYVFPNTSGLVALMKYPEKLALWENLVSDMRLVGETDSIKD